MQTLDDLKIEDECWKSICESIDFWCFVDDNALSDFKTDVVQDDDKLQILVQDVIDHLNQRENHVDILQRKGDIYVQMFTKTGAFVHRVFAYSHYELPTVARLAALQWIWQQKNT